MDFETGCSLRYELVNRCEKHLRKLWSVNMVAQERDHSIAD